ncbi:helix-turn-helix domain-containing protein [Limosilactobacillus mucosae]|uniref:helix-turn-helix domain-containing protein n=1 Tax=Limosilactobacillus mucosae TaxID=97478 RepID=UPI0022E64EC7|nr:helix-turn-helix transcriptional regulator [Limosilactobacillus mucosae]
MNRLREVRKEHGLTLKQLSKKLKDIYGISITPDGLSKYERSDREPSIKVLKAYAELFEVTIDYLLGAVGIQCARETDDESDFEYLEEMYDLEYCPYCGRKL